MQERTDHPPRCLPMITGRVFKYGDDVNTDVLFPGKYTYTLRRAEEIAEHALEDLDPTFVERVRPGDVVVGGHNWGCGSSREQAVTCLVANRVGAVVAKSFSRIFYRNAVNHALPVLVCPAAVDALGDGERVSIDLEAAILRSPAGDFPLPPLASSVRRLLEAGGLIPYTARRLAAARPGSTGP